MVAYLGKVVLDEEAFQVLTTESFSSVQRQNQDLGQGCFDQSLVLGDGGHGGESDDSLEVAGVSRDAVTAKKDESDAFRGRERGKTTHVSSKVLFATSRSSSPSVCHSA